jgi:hypothetical protein
LICGLSRGTIPGSGDLHRRDFGVWAMTALLEKMVLRFTEAPLESGKRRDADARAAANDRFVSVTGSGEKKAS